MRYRTALLVACLAASPVRAVEFSGTATTVLRAFDVLHVELRENMQPIQRVISYRPLDQTVRLTWDDMGERRAWSVDVAVRGRTDLSTGKGDWQEDDLDVLLAQARWTSKHRLLGLTLGRQQSITSFGWHSFDGVRLDFDKARHVRAFVQAGLPVDTWDGGGSDLDGFTWATGVTGVLPKHGSVGIDYEIRRGEGIVLEETAGFDASLRAGRTSFDANADYSMLLDTFGETTLVLGQEIRRRHHLEARWSRVRPVFTADDIWSVFELNPYDEARLAYEFRGDGALDVGGYISLEDYVSPEDVDPALDDDDLPEDIRRAAVTLRWEGRREAVHRSEIGWQDGWTGSRLAAMHDSDWALTPRWRVGAGLSLHRYENRYRLDEEDEVVAARGRVSYDHGGKWDVALSAEQFFGRDRDTLRGTLIFTTRFGHARGTLPWWGGEWTRSRPGGTAPKPRPVAEAQ